MARKKRDPRIGSDAETEYLRAWLAGFHGEQKDLAERIGCSESWISQVKAEEAEVGAKHLIAWARELGFSSVEDFRVAAYRRYVAIRDIRDMPGTATSLDPRALLGSEARRHGT